MLDAHQEIWIQNCERPPSLLSAHKNNHTRLCLLYLCLCFLSTTHLTAIHSLSKSVSGCLGESPGGTSQPSQQLTAPAAATSLMNTNCSALETGSNGCLTARKNDRGWWGQMVMRDREKWHITTARRKRKKPREDVTKWGMERDGENDRVEGERKGDAFMVHERLLDFYSNSASLSVVEGKTLYRDLQSTISCLKSHTASAGLYYSLMLLIQETTLAEGSDCRTLVLVQCKQPQFDLQTRHVLLKFWKKSVTGCWCVI